ncbi:hypothetical protein SANTM175S_10607 [Streptomyces antimycoticus]
MPLAEEPMRLARQTVSTRGQFSGASGFSQANFSPPEASCSATYSPAGRPLSCTRRPSSRELAEKVG